MKTNEELSDKDVEAEVLHDAQKEAERIKKVAAAGFTSETRKMEDRVQELVALLRVRKIVTCIREGITPDGVEPSTVTKQEIRTVIEFVEGRANHYVDMMFGW